MRHVFGPAFDGSAVMLHMDRCWTAHDIIVIDTETCGLNPEDGICDIAAVRFSKGVEIAHFTSLVNPGRPIPAEAQAIHGITDEMVKDAPTLAELEVDLVRMSDNAVPCAYSASFDRSFVHHQLTAADCHALDPAFKQWLDVLVVVRDADKFASGKGRHRLESACKRHGVALEGAHRALPDASATGALLFRLLETGRIKRCPLGKLLEHIEARAAIQDAEFQSWLARQPKREGASV